MSWFIGELSGYLWPHRVLEHSVKTAKRNLKLSSNLIFESKYLDVRIGQLISWLARH